MPDTMRHPRGSYHSHKRQLLGNQNAKQPPPAWKNPPNVVAGKKPDSGSKIYVSNLPTDVETHDIVELFVKTIGPVKNAFLIYDRDGRKMGMAIVEFQHPGDALSARNKYDGLTIDGKARISVEVITRHMKTAQPLQTPKLIERISKGPAGTKQIPAQPQPQPQPQPVKPKNTNTSAVPAPTIRRRVRKGAKRVNKLAAIARKTVEDLDREIDEYKLKAGQGP